ncbi:hypothetical protein D3D02_12200 [Halobellus sp. Atlit-38R]|uniref:hypothetical protein n=1 Tax=Halobellus sp. Atlit-38R TaxID=2282131 RepID=UPI000EF27F9C|nr:hypothetical protein [Halobellus sp. Atlit-38R]RLM88326.1 hypothetical protein D3D02_12200 [Halobellus sp. Atlit-38R]
MTPSGVPATLSRKHLLAVVVIAMALTGAGVGVLSDGFTLSRGPGPAEVGDAAAPLATIKVTASDPVAIRNDAGDVGVVSGTLGGTLTLAEGADRVEFVVQTRLPNGTWAVAASGTATGVPAGQLNLEPGVGGPDTIYLDAAQSDGFDVQEPGTVAVRRGAIAVTARLFVGDEVIATVTDVDGYELTVDRPAPATMSFAPVDESATEENSDATGASDPTDTTRRTITQTGSGSDGGPESGSGADASDADETTDSTTPTTAFFGTGDVVPGSAGKSAAVLEPTSAEMTTLEVTVGAAIDAENGVTEPESVVDETPEDGELSSELDVRIVLVRESGDREYVAGSADAFVPLSTAAGATASLAIEPNEPVSLVVEWRIDPTVGNEIQSDSTTASIHYRFTSDPS